jgi:hypothetical protein
MLRKDGSDTDTGRQGIERVIQLLKSQHVGTAPVSFSPDQVRKALVHAGQRYEACNEVAVPKKCCRCLYVGARFPFFPHKQE